MNALDAERLQIGVRWNINIAPALPPARRFCGICYLHGRVDEPQDMVLTDKNIGRAYMDEGWALRFAHAIFQRFDILFVGYSLEDPPLRYLSLALEGLTERERWALVPDPGLDASKKTENERDWIRRDVKPIWYPAKDGDYRALERTIDAWGKDISRSFLDRRSFLSDISKTNPNHLKPYELSRAKFFLNDPPSLRDFAKASLDINWFDTLLSWGHFDLLLKGSGIWNEADGFLVDRLIDWMRSNPVELLDKIAEHRTSMHTAVLDQFCRRYETNTTPDFDSALLRQVLEFFRPTIDRKRSFVSAAFFIKRMFADLLDNKFEDDAFWLLSIALRTETVISKRINFAFQFARSEGQATDSLPEYELQYELRFENQLTEHNLRELFEEMIFPRIAAVGFRLAHFLTLKFMELR